MSKFEGRSTSVLNFRMAKAMSSASLMRDTSFDLLSFYFVLRTSTFALAASICLSVPLCLCGLPFSSPTSKPWGAVQSQPRCL